MESKKSLSTHPQQSRAAAVHTSPAGIARPAVMPQFPGVVQRELATYDDIHDLRGDKNFRWTSFYTNISSNSSTKSITDEGRGAKTPDSDNELKTKVTWQPVHNTAKEGTGMLALPLGPDHKLGTVPSTDKKSTWVRRRNQLNAIDEDKSYKAGHLLNRDLGGPGTDPRNLTAIPAETNSQFETAVEDEVKRLVNDEHKFVFFEVKVTYKDVPTSNIQYAAEIEATWGPVKLTPNATKGDSSTSVTIIVDPPQKTTDREIAKTGEADFSKTPVAEFDGVKQIILTNNVFLKDAFNATVALREKLNEIEKANAKLIKELIAYEINQNEYEETIANLEEENEEIQTELQEMKINIESIITESERKTEKIKGQAITIEQFELENEKLLKQVKIQATKIKNLKTDQTDLIFKMLDLKEALRFGDVEKAFLKEKLDKKVANQDIKVQDSPENEVGSIEEEPVKQELPEKDSSPEDQIKQTQLKDMFLEIYNSELLRDNFNIRINTIKWRTFYSEVLKKGSAIELKALYKLVQSLYDIAGDYNSDQKNVNAHRVKEIYEIAHGL